MKRTLVITHLTLHEAARKRVLLAALLLGAAFVTLDAIGFHYLVRGFTHQVGAQAMAERHFTVAMFTLAGLYAVNFLAAMAAVLLPIDTLSGEIASGVVQTVASKPIRRIEIVLGKWLAYAGVAVAYQLGLAVGVLVVAATIGHYVPPGLVSGLALLSLEVVALVTLSIAGGTRLATVTNGMLAFGLYGLAFIGGRVEQIGAVVHNVAALNVGTIASLVMPTDALCQRAAHQMQPPLFAQLQATPFSSSSVPSPAMVAWAGAWTLGVLLLALRGFAKRSL